MSLQSQLARLDAMLDRRIGEQEDADRLADARREDARRERQRENAEARREIAARYDDAFAAFGTTVPAAVDDEPVARYRARLFNRLARRLPQTSEWGDIRADDISSATAMDKVEQLVLEAAQREGLKPSFENLPADGSLISRQKVDPETNERSIEWHGRRSFIADMGRPGQKVERVLNPKTGDVLWGRAFPKR